MCLKASSHSFSVRELIRTVLRMTESAQKMGEHNAPAHKRYVKAILATVSIKSIKTTGLERYL
jgi:hypothetical protein